MSLIIATGSNIGNKLENLKNIKEILKSKFNLIANSDVFESEAVDYFDQPDFYNQLLEFKIPRETPLITLRKILSIEKDFGRLRDIDKGPRIIDIDIIFWGTQEINEPGLTVPHPSWSERSFVVRPLQQLPFFQTLEKCFKIPNEFKVEAKPINKS